MNDLEDFYSQLLASVQTGANADGIITVEAFFDYVGELLTEAGEIDVANRSYYEGSFGRRSIQIDGFGGDPRESDGILSLILCDFSCDDEIKVLHKDQAMRLAHRVFGFLNASFDEAFRDNLEETSEGFGIADLISSTWKKVEKVKLIIVTNGDIRARADAVIVKEVDGRPVTLSFWDLKRLKKFMEQGQARANLVIDFIEDFGSGIPLLEASGSDAPYRSYLAVIPGQQLAQIYDKWGPRLLEANVRSFLQARGKVNRGIRDTIRGEPQMFFPYNNGLSATADDVEVNKTEKGLELVKAHNLQIVNGGQTTASLHSARKQFISQLDSIYVQMKLTIVPSEDSEIIVPRISEYANSQNRVNAADFFSNHPFHIKIEELSRRMLAPAGHTGLHETKWFYERARGQYADKRSQLTPAGRKKFDAEYPRSQFFTKTDLAKYENTWSRLPHIVSLGAQKNFTNFAKQIAKLWGTSGTSFNDLKFKRMVAKAIVFKSTERIVSSADWYEGGYRANIVSYAIAKIVDDADKRNMAVNLETIWRNQEISPGLRDAIFVAGRVAQDVIMSPTGGIRNFSEWAKQQACWKRLADRKVRYSDSFDSVLTTPDKEAEIEKDARKDQKISADIDAQIRVVEIGSDQWARAREWGLAHKLLSPRENGILDICANLDKRIPSSKQSEAALASLKKLTDEGFELDESAGSS